MAENENEKMTEETAESVCNESAETEDTAAKTEENADSSSDESENKADAQKSQGNTEAGKDENVEEAKKKLFGKKEKKSDPRDEKIAELNDRVMRQMAEFDNFRKRTEREKSQMFDIGAKSVLEKFLPIVDNFDRGFAGLTEEELATPFAQGMEKTYRQLQTVLEGIGVKPIEAVGLEFDPNLHNAIMHEEKEDVGENIITEEFQKGYTYHDAVLRHSMVKVAN